MKSVLPLYNPLNKNVATESQKRILFIIILSMLAMMMLFFLLMFRDINTSQITPVAITGVPFPLKNLIIVPCHAIYLGSAEGPQAASSWILESYQKQANQHHTFISHIKRSIDIAKEDKSSLLVFSGGMTRTGASGTTEAGGYWHLSHDMGLLQTEIVERIVTEDYARDSLENLMFSLARFYEMTLRWPEKIVVVGFEFKRKRFEELHRKALKWPAEKFQYIGIDPDSVEDIKAAQQGEAKYSYLPFLKDLYGCRSPLLDKKLSRNPYRRTPPYVLSVPAIKQLLQWCPSKGDQVFNAQLPWS